MNLKHLSDNEVLKATMTAASDERAATTKLLHHLCEVDSRRLFAKAGCSSLFAYCVQCLKMSEPQAARRVNAARALKEFPEIEEKIESGDLTLTALNQAQISFKKESRSKEKKREILKQLEQKSTREVEKILVSHSSSPAEVRESVKVVSESLTELRFGADAELMKDLERLKEVWGISSLAELFKKMAAVSLKHSDPMLKAERAKKSPAPPPESGKRYISAPVRHQVWIRDQGSCTYVDHATGRHCCSQYRLQLDHIVPFAKGGQNTLENLRLRCFAHNQWHAIEEYGPDVLRFSRVP